MYRDISGHRGNAMCLTEEEDRLENWTVLGSNPRSATFFFNREFVFNLFILFIYF